MVCAGRGMQNARDLAWIEEHRQACLPAPLQHAGNLAALTHSRATFCCGVAGCASKTLLSVVVHKC